jgi:hypothetical protein
VKEKRGVGCIKNVEGKGVMKMKGRLLIATLVILGITGAGVVVYGTSNVLADDAFGDYPPIVQKLVEKFGLDEGEVKGVFDEMREEKQVQMQNRFEERLTQGVESGEITGEQKQLILAKHEELRAGRQNDWAEMGAWAKENGIEMSFFGPGGKRGSFGHW